MNRIDRLSAILIHLQSKKRVTAQEIANRFEISLRSVYRDVKALQESGVPIIGESGIGYSVMEGYRLPPVMFTKEEASSLLFAGKLAEIFTDPIVKKYFANALYKIKSVLRYTDKEYIETLDENIVVFPSVYGSINDVNAQHLSEIQKAIVSKTVLNIQYCKARETISEVRDIEPIGLCYYGNAWHCIAWCRLRKDYRDFKLSRIFRLCVTGTMFNNVVHSSISDYINKEKKEKQLIEIVIKVKKESAVHVQELKYYYGFVSEEVVGEYVRMTFLSVSLEYFARWALAFVDSLIIEKPMALKNRVAAMSEKLYKHHVGMDAPETIK